MQDGVDIVQRFAHSHHDEVSHAFPRMGLLEDAAGVQDLGDDFAGPQVAHEAHLTGGAKYAAHGAAGLGADANGVPTVVSHQDGLDSLTVLQAKQELAGAAVRTADFIDDFGVIEKIRFALADVLGDPALERREKIERLEVEFSFELDGAPQSLGVVVDDAVRGQNTGKLGESEIVQ